MKMRTAWSLVFLAVLMLSSVAWSQSELEDPFRQSSVPNVGVSDERFSLEREGNALTLYWQGWITLVQPTDRPVVITIRYTLDPSGRWRTRPRTLSLANPFAVGVNSVFQKFDVAQIDLGPETGASGPVPPLQAVLDKDQLFTLRLTLKPGDTSISAAPLAEESFRMSPVGYELIRASGEGNRAEVEGLIGLGASVDAATLQGWNPLMAACAGGHVEIVRLLLDRKANVVAETDGFRMLQSPNGSSIPGGDTPLLVAAYAGNPQIARMLVDSGATYGDMVRRLRKVGASNEDLVRLISEKGPGYQEIVNRLVARGASPKDMVALADRAGYAEIVWRLSRRGVVLADVMDRLQKAGLSEQDIVARLQKEGAAPQEIDLLVRGKCINEGDLRMCLQEKGGSSEEIDQLVSERNTSEQQVRKCLVDKGALGSDADRLLRERAVSDEGLRKFLRDKGATEEEIDQCLREKGAAPDDIVAFLLKHGGSVDARRGNGWTPIMAAAFSGNPEIIRLFLDEGANPNAMDDNGYSPAAFAYINGNGAAYKMLARRGGRLTVPWGSPLDYP
jgi:ankyrin repeat protein